MKTLEQLCRTALYRSADFPAIEFEGTWFNWGQMRSVAEKVWLLLEQSGADPAAPVAFVPRNRPSALATLLALIAQGRTIRMCYAFQSPTALAQNIKRLNSAVVIATEQEFSSEVTTVLASEGIAAIAISDMDAHAVAGHEQIAVKARNENSVRKIEILTSGTTGTPKQFPVDYTMIEKFMVANLIAGDTRDYSQDVPALLYFPLGNITGIFTTVPPLLSGQRIVLLDRFSLEKWHDFVVRYRPVSTGIPPASMHALLQSNIPIEDLASLKAMGMGAAPLDASLHREFEERYQIPILLSYGATEFGGPVTAMTPELHARWGKEKFGSVGKPILGAQLRVIDAQTNDLLPPGKVGILEVVSPRMGSHWIRTSDMAVIDGDGFLFLHGRADGAIMRGGFKILPETIERALLLHPAVAAVAVVGVPDKRLTEVPAAAIQIKAGCKQPSIEDLSDYLRDNVLATHIPVHWRFVENLPKNQSFKVDRPAVKRLFEQELQH